MSEQMNRWMNGQLIERDAQWVNELVKIGLCL